jgi:hypothetical protein
VTPTAGPRGGAEDLVPGSTDVEDDQLIAPGPDLRAVLVDEADHTEGGAGDPDGAPDAGGTGGAELVIADQPWARQYERFYAVEREPLVL